jgi:2-oxo-3-hexenedioate decarboxylase
LLPEETVAVNETELDAIAAQLRAARAAGRPVSPLSNSLPAFDVTAGYVVQESLRRQAGELAGWKLGLTSPAKQVQMSVAEPIRGYLAACDELLEGEALGVADYIQPRVEPEIVFVMGDDLEGARVNKDDVLAATAALAVGIEILDSRYIDYRFSLPDVVADNGSAARFVVGPHVPPQGLELRLAGVVLEHRGEVAATAAGAASLGHPAAAVAWLVRSLAGVGQGLRAGDIVLSGGLTAAIAVAPGDFVTASIDRLGSVSLACV